MHQPNLETALGLVCLVDADGVDPDAEVVGWVSQVPQSGV
jgi:hypothetical protein